MTKQQKVKTFDQHFKDELHAILKNPTSLSVREKQLEQGKVRTRKQVCAPTLSTVFCVYPNKPIVPEKQVGEIKHLPPQHTSLFFRYK